MIFLVLCFNLIGRLLDLSRSASGGFAPWKGAGGSFLLEFAQWDGELLTSLQLLLNVFGVESIVEMQLILRYLLAFFIFDWSTGMEGLGEGCCYTTDWISQTGHSALLKLSSP